MEGWTWLEALENLRKVLGFRVYLGFRDYVGVLQGLYGYILGLCWDNGKNGNYDQLKEGFRFSGFRTLMRASAGAYGTFPKEGGPQYRPSYTIVLINETPPPKKEVSLILANPQMIRGFLVVIEDLSRMDSGFATEGLRYENNSTLTKNKNVNIHPQKMENDSALTNFPLTSSSPQNTNCPAHTAGVCSAYSLAQRSIATCCFEFPILSRNALAAFKVSSENL